MRKFALFQQIPQSTFMALTKTNLTNPTFIWHNMGVENLIVQWLSTMAFHIGKSSRYYEAA